jgi:hypothetical protein
MGGLVNVLLGNYQATHKANYQATHNVITGINPPNIQKANYQATHNVITGINPPNIQRRFSVWRQMELSELRTRPLV